MADMGAYTASYIIEELRDRVTAKRLRETDRVKAELSDVIKYAIPPAAREGGHHPAKRSFQAIRIEVNGELDGLDDLCDFANRLEAASIKTLEDGIMTKDLIGLSNLENKKGVYMAEFISAIASNLERMQK